MAKAINWPISFYDEIISEDTDSFFVALRPGSLYSDTKYYHKGDVVDVRVNHKIVRKAVIAKNLITAKIKDLDHTVLDYFKKGYQSKNKIADFLKTNYNKPIDESSTVTVITYYNLPVEQDVELDDPHM